MVPRTRTHLPSPRSMRISGPSLRRTDVAWPPIGDFSAWLGSSADHGGLPLLEPPASTVTALAPRPKAHTVDTNTIDGGTPATSCAPGTKKHGLPARAP